MNDLELIKDDLRVHEGFSKHAYNDHLGYLTIGYGRLIDRRKGGGLSKDEAEMLLENDIVKAYNSLSEKIIGFDNFPKDVKRALINMAFQMGVSGVLAFKRTIGYIQGGEYGKAADEALNSKWATQTPNRAKEVTDWIRNA